jgi:hypothetical protein
MAATLDQIRQGLANNLASIPDIQVSPFMLAQPTPPGIHVFPGPLTYDQAMSRGLDIYNVVAQAYVAFTTDIGSQKLLDRMCEPSGANSVKTQIEKDRTLGGIVGTVQVTGMSGYRVVQRDTGGPLLVAEWDITVYSS